MFKKLGLILVVVFAIILVTLVILSNRSVDEDSLISPIGKSIEKTLENVKPKPDSELADKNRINVLLLGIDRRSKAEAAYRTDIMILLAIDKTTNEVVMTSIPRDLWWDGGRLNAVFIQSGWEELQTAFATITGVKPDRYIIADFADFSWIVDSMGGVPVEVQTTFTDTSYPIDETFDYQTVTFTQGYEKLTGERALIFARSRKGDYDNGDWGRMKRQHLILKGFLEAVAQPESTFNPIVVESAFKTVTEKGMETNLTVGDAKYLWDFYKDKDVYNISSIYMDHDYVYTPPMEDYGGAWVLIPINNDHTKLKTDIEAILAGQNIQPVAQEDIEVLVEAN